MIIVVRFQPWERFILALLLIFVGSTSVLSEELSENRAYDPTERLTPNAKSFQRFGDIPVTLYTGTPNISIPLGNFTDGHLTLPFNLSYHSSGIRVEDHPGWTGLGWNLSVGGAITREVRDIPDEVSEHGYIEMCGKLGIDKLRASDIGNFVEVQNNSLTSLAAIYATEDTEPDKFNFNFGEYSGFFVMGSDGKWHISCDKPLTVKEYELFFPSCKFQNGSSMRTTQPRTFKRFVLVGEDGTQYEFGNDAIEYSINARAQTSNYWVANSWMLTSIKNTKGDNIAFQYERGDFIVNFTNSYSNIIAANQFGVKGDSKSGQLVSPVYLSEIASRTFTAKFHSSESTELDYTAVAYMDRYNNSDPNTSHPYYWPSDPKNLTEDINWRQLDEIVFYDYNGVQIRRVNLYFSNSTSQRLTLNKIEIREFDSTVNEKFTFGYRNIAALPPYLSDKTDHWGFYNAGSGTIHTDTYKQTNPATVGYGALNKITYPTGGYTLFDFEPNTYSTIANIGPNSDGKKYAGGVRIRRIINIPNDSTVPEIKEFKYAFGYEPGRDDLVESGILVGKPQYRYSRTVLANGSPMTIDEESNNSLSSIQSSYGSHVCYASVTEVRADSSYTTTEFITPDDLTFRDEPPIISTEAYPFVFHSLKGQYRGKPKRISTYSNDGRLIAETSISYGIPDGDEQFVQGFMLDWVNLKSLYNSHGGDLIFPKYSLYRHYVHRIREMQITETQYGLKGNIKLHTLRTNSYNTEGQPTALATTYNSGKNEILEVKRIAYAWENDQECVNRHILDEVSSITVSRNGKTTSSVRQTYSSATSGARYLCKVEDTTLPASPKLVYECLCSDSKGFPIHVRNGKGLETVYLWSADRQVPLAEIKNATPAEVSAVLGYDPECAALDPNIHDSLAKLRPGLKDAMITTFTYIPFIGITAVTSPSGHATHFEYDWQKRLTDVRNHYGELLNRYFYSSFSGQSSGSASSLTNTKSGL